MDHIHQSSWWVLQFCNKLSLSAVNAPSIQALRCILQRYDLPDLESPMSNPFSYFKWKQLIKFKIKDAVHSKTAVGILKSSLKYWSGKRAQLLSYTYLVQTRLCKIQKAADLLCLLCKGVDDTVGHFIASCPTHLQIRHDFVSKVNECLRDYPLCASQYDGCDPCLFTKATFLPLDHLLHIEVYWLLLYSLSIKCIYRDLLLSVHHLDVYLVLLFSYMSCGHGIADLRNSGGRTRRRRRRNGLFNL